MDERTDAVSGSDEIREIRRDIERTQREMARTIEKIQYRLSPHTIMERTKNSVREAGVRNSRKFTDKIRANPIPAAMVGVGLWLLMRDSDREASHVVDFAPEFDDQWTSRSSVAEYRDFDFEGARSGGVRERAGEAVDTAKAKVGAAREATTEAMHAAAERAQHLGEATAYRARRAAMETRDLMRDAPLVAGLAALAVGAMVAAAIPETDLENRTFGETGDRLKDRAKDLAAEGVDRAKDIAVSAASAATDAAKKEVSATSQKTDRAETIGVGRTQA